VSKLPCGHPLAARAIRAVDGDLVTVCWACEVAQEIVAASRTRAKGYNNAVEYGDSIAHNAQRPPVRLYSESEGVDVPEYRRNG
jgi:hypothetical protein